MPGHIRGTATESRQTPWPRALQRSASGIIVPCNCLANYATRSQRLTRRGYCPAVVAAQAARRAMAAIRPGRRPGSDTDRSAIAPDRSPGNDPSRRDRFWACPGLRRQPVFCRSGSAWHGSAAKIAPQGNEYRACIDTMRLRTGPGGPAAFGRPAGWGRFRRPAGGFPVGAGCAAAVRFGGTLVALGAIIGDVEPAAFEDQSPPAAKQTPHPSLRARRTLADWCRSDRLKPLEPVSTRFALVFVSWHRHPRMNHKGPANKPADFNPVFCSPRPAPGAARGH